jgi:hypothetical protein
MSLKSRLIEFAAVITAQKKEAVMVAKLIALN